jgi:hypothetical protein
MMRDTALKYHGLGFSVIPLSPNSKIPPKGFNVVKYRQERADIAEIWKWWEENPKYNIGIITGKTSNLFVVDIDSEVGLENINQFIPDSLITPTVKSPRGQHLYFKYPKQSITIGTGKKQLEGTDFRGEGGYIVAPPSVINGSSYEWLVNLDAPLADLPVVYINYLINSSIIYSNNYNYSNISERTSAPSVLQKSSCNMLQDVTISLTKGHRNESLFHVANTLIKGGMTKVNVLMILETLAKTCNPPIGKNEIVTICNSALERAERKERNISREVDDFIESTNGYFSVTDCYNVLHAVTKEDRTAVRVALSRQKGKTIEKHGERDGVWKRINREIEFINFDLDEEDETPFPIELPFDLHELVEISEGNIIVVAGEFNSGKTTFLLNILKKNKGKVPIRYISSEMSKSEFKKRFRGFGIPLDFWKQDDKTDYVKKSCDFYSVLKPDGINIIDYLEFRDSEYQKGAEYLRQIHDRLGKGIAIVAIQKKEGLRMPRSGDMVLEKPRLAISFTKLDSSGEYPQGYCEIIKAKIPRLGKIDGKKLRYEIVNNGSKFSILNDWGYLKF